MATIHFSKNMATIHFTREQILTAPLDEEEHALLSMLVELDFSEKYQLEKHVRPLIATRLQQIMDARKQLSLPAFDSARAAEAEADLRAEMDDRI